MAEPQQEKRACTTISAPRASYASNARMPLNPRSFAMLARGAFVSTLSPTVAQGSPIGFTLTLPPEITLTESIRVQCKGRVVRVENGRADGKLAVAAVIEEYEFLPEA